MGEHSLICEGLLPKKKLNLNIIKALNLIASLQKMWRLIEEDKWEQEVAISQIYDVGQSTTVVSNQDPGGLLKTQITGPHSQSFCFSKTG